MAILFSPLNKKFVSLVPKLLLGNPVLEALASCHAKQDFRVLHSQAEALIVYTSLKIYVIPAGIHDRLSCLSPFGLMQICSRQICAGIQTSWMDQAYHPWHWIPASRRV
ncbi:MAG: hypothetical protein LUQ06_03090 [Methylococcaceae bacterium]|nr:hypothetical protein [Methylococcaceae bacterium]